MSSTFLEIVIIYTYFDVENIRDVSNIINGKYIINIKYILLYILYTNRGGGTGGAQGHRAPPAPPNFLDDP